MFSRLDWTGNEAWDLLFLGNGDALLCESYVLLYLHNGVMTEVPGASQVYPRVLLRSAFNPDLVYVGTETGMALLERMGDNWIYVYHNTEMDNWQATTLVELAEGRILVGTERGGIRALDFEKYGEWQLVANRHLVTDQNGEGILSDSAVLRTQDGNILASMGDALYSYADGNLQSGALGALAAARTDTRTLYFSEDQSGQKWAFSWNRLYRESGAGSWEQVDFSGLGAGVLNELVFDQSGDPVFVFDTGLGFYNAHLPAGEHQPALRISSVRVTNALEQVKPLSLAPGTRPSMAQTDWINIRFSLPDFRNPERVQYNTRLKPIEQGDNRWDESSQVSFFALEPGDYEFELTARDSQGRVSDTLHYAFSVAPWWYQTAAMKVLWVIIALTGFSSLMWYGAWLRSRRLLVANANLEMQVRQRTLELEHANRQLGNLANLDGLTGIPNRRKLQSYLEDVWTRCADHERELTLILFDVDHFKNYNDKYGHQTGDEALRNLVQVVARCLRRSEDMVARYGGEEFIVVLPGAGLVVGMAVAEEIRLAVEASDAGVTLSAGVACGRP
jgi:diguanylate cyclase (GGDEF)-like protein